MRDHPRCVRGCEQTPRSHHWQAQTWPEGTAISEKALESLDDALLFAESLPTVQAAHLVEAARAAFDQAFVGVIVMVVAILVTAALLIRHLHGGATPRVSDNAR